MATGTRYTYTDTVTSKRAIGDVIHMIDWKESAAAAPLRVRS